MKKQKMLGVSSKAECHVINCSMLADVEQFHDDIFSIHISGLQALNLGGCLVFAGAHIIGPGREPDRSDGIDYYFLLYFLDFECW